MDYNFSFPELTIPEASLRILREGKILKVWDILRKKYLILTPEEYVRQRFVHWLVHHLHYPTTHLANEIGIELNGTKKRCDTVLFDRQGCPLGIFEFKAPDILITQKVFDQILRYNSVLRAPFLVVSNGVQHFFCRLDRRNERYVFLPSIPDYNLLIKLKS